MTDGLKIGEPDYSTVSTLWSDASMTRQFLIPDTCQLSPGDFVLRTATGREWQVDPAALAKFEISNEEAKAWLEKQLRGVMKKLGTGMSEAQSREAPLSGAEEKFNKPGTSDDAQKSATPGLDLLADITGTPRESLNTDYAAVGGALRSYLENMVQTTSDAASGEADRMEAARERMRQWAEILRKHGVVAPSVSPASTDNTSTQTPDTPTKSTSSKTSEPFSETQKKTSFSDRLRELAEDFRSRADALAAAREGKIPEPAPVDDKNVSRSKNFDSTQVEFPPTEDALKAAAALESTAQSIESAAEDTAKWLRDLAAQLRSDPAQYDKTKLDGDKFSGKS